MLSLSGLRLFISAVRRGGNALLKSLKFWCGRAPLPVGHQRGQQRSVTQQSKQSRSLNRSPIQHPALCQEESSQSP